MEKQADIQLKQVPKAEGLLHDVKQFIPGTQEYQQETRPQHQGTGGMMRSSEHHETTMGPGGTYTEKPHHAESKHLFALYMLKNRLIVNLITDFYLDTVLNCSGHWRDTLSPHCYRSCSRSSMVGQALNLFKTLNFTKKTLNSF